MSNDKDIVRKFLASKAASDSLSTMQKSLHGIIQKNSTKSEPKKNIYKINPGDSLWKIAHDHGVTIDSLREANPRIQNSNMIHPDETLIIPITSTTTSKKPTSHNLKQVEAEEKELNRNNLSAIQGYAHNSNYAIVDKKNHTLTVYDKNNKELYKTNTINTGLNQTDYNTITYVNKNGQIKNNAGNNSTPAGITYITGIGNYHGAPSFTRGRLTKSGDYEDVASSFHFGHIDKNNSHKSNGCVRMDTKTLQDLSKFLSVGTPIYTLPEASGSRFVLSQGKLNFVADNPYGSNTGENKYWDDYNVTIDKSYNPLIIKGHSNNKQVNDYIQAIVDNKERIQKDYKLSSSEYDNLAKLAMGLAGQESDYGESGRYKVKQFEPLVNLGKKLTGNTSVNSRGLTQIKMEADSPQMQKMYNNYGLTPKSVASKSGHSGIATMLRLADMYTNEVKGRTFTDAQNKQIDPYDALLYKWSNQGNKLNNSTAIPSNNTYLNNVKNYADQFDYYSVYAEGGPIKHTIAKGETLSSISKKYGVPISVIQQANGLTSDKIIAGNTLTIIPPIQSVNFMQDVARNSPPVNPTTRNNNVVSDRDKVVQGQRYYDNATPYEQARINATKHLSEANKELAASTGQLLYDGTNLALNAVPTPVTNALGTAMDIGDIVYSANGVLMEKDPQEKASAFGNTVENTFGQIPNKIGAVWDAAEVMQDLYELQDAYQNRHNAAREYKYYNNGMLPWQQALSNSFPKLRKVFKSMPSGGLENQVNPSTLENQYAKGGIMTSWNDLSIHDKRLLIKEGVKNGITNIDDIISIYNNISNTPQQDINTTPTTVYADGGPIGRSSEDNYEDYFEWLQQLADKKSSEWGEPYGYTILDMLNNNAYDYKAFYEQDPQSAWEYLNSPDGTHFTDIGKTVNHETFSNESMYSSENYGDLGTGANPYNIAGPYWNGEQLIDNQGNIIFDGNNYGE